MPSGKGDDLMGIDLLGELDKEALQSTPVKKKDGSRNPSWIKEESQVWRKKSKEEDTYLPPEQAKCAWCQLVTPAAECHTVWRHQQRQ